MSYSVQPETLSWDDDGHVRRYTPDRLDLMADGSTRFVEIKDAFDRGLDLEYAEKLQQAAQIYGALGHAFELREGSSIRLEPQFTAIEEIQAYRRAVVTMADVDRVRLALAHGALPLHQALASLERAQSRPVLFAMMVRRIVSIDLTRGLHEGTGVSLVQAGHKCAD